MKDIKKKRPLMDTPKSWNLIFTILFPQAVVPESPCKVGPNEVHWLGTNSWVDVDTPGREILLHFCRVAPPILSRLLRNNVLPSLPPGALDPNMLDRISRQCIDEATQLVASETGTTLLRSRVNGAMDFHDDESGPLYSYSPTQPGPTTLPQQNRMDPNPLQGQYLLTNQGYSSFYQPGGNIDQGHSYSNNMGSTDPTSMGYYVSPEQPDEGDVEAMLDFTFP